MSRKTKIITLGILGVVAAVGAVACCIAWFDQPWGEGQEGRRFGHGGRHGFFWHTAPLFVNTGGGGGTRTTPSTGHGSSSTSRGGFGATGSHSSGGIGA